MPVTKAENYQFEIKLVVKPCEPSEVDISGDIDGEDGKDQLMLGMSEAICLIEDLYGVELVKKHLKRWL